jgi:hypothetical protein
MARMWSLVPIPKGVHKLGELMVHDMSLGKALESLTPEEQQQIAQRQRLEDVVKPMCEWVASHTLRAEQKVTPVLKVLFLHPLSSPACMRCQHTAVMKCALTLFQWFNPRRWQGLAKRLGAELHGLEFRVKSALVRALANRGGTSTHCPLLVQSMTRKLVTELRDKDVIHSEESRIEAAVWCQQRNALRYTVVCKDDSYTSDVRAIIKVRWQIKTASSYAMAACTHYTKLLL